MNIRDVLQVIAEIALAVFSVFAFIWGAFLITEF